MAQYGAPSRLATVDQRYGNRPLRVNWMTNGNARLDADALRRHVSLVTIAGKYVALRRQGRDHVGLCPFHEEKHPSFTVYSKDGRQSFKCFGCGASGDVFDFIGK